MDEGILEAHVDLRLAALARHAGYAGGDRAREWVRGKIAPLHGEGTVRERSVPGTVRVHARVCIAVARGRGGAELAPTQDARLYALCTVPTMG